MPNVGHFTVAFLWFCIAANTVYSGVSDCDLKKSDQLSRQGRNSNALEALAGCGDDPVAMKTKGLIYHDLYAPDSTVFYLKKAFEKGLHDDGLLTALAEAFLWKKDFRSAKDVMESVKDKGSASFLKVTARKHEILGEFGDAVKAYDQAIALEKLPYGTMERKAIILSWMKKFPESIAQFDAILNVKVVSRPLKIRCMIRKAEVQSWQNQFDLALAGLNKALVMDKQNIDARLVKAKVLEWKGDFKSAKPIYVEILKMQPTNDQAKLRLEKLAWVEE